MSRSLVVVFVAVTGACDGRGGDDSDSGPVTVAAVLQDGNPAVGWHVVWSDPAGEVLNETNTDDDGRATHPDLPRGGMVTVASPSGAIDLVTLAGLDPGQQPEVTVRQHRDVVYPSGDLLASPIVNMPALADATEYYFANPICEVTGQRVATSSNIYTSVFSDCVIEGVYDLIFVALDAAGAVIASSRLDDIAADTITITALAWQPTLGGFDLQLPEIDETWIDWVITSDVRLDDLLWRVPELRVPVPPPTVVPFPVPDLGGDGARGRVRLEGESEFWDEYYDIPDHLPVRADFIAAPPRLRPTGLTETAAGTSGRPRLTWTSLAEETPDLIASETAWEDPAGYASWRIFMNAPGGAIEITLPALPDALATLRPPEDTVLQCIDQVWFPEAGTEPDWGTITGETFDDYAQSFPGALRLSAWIPTD